MAEFKTAFVAIILFFCLFQNGCAQQYENYNAQSQLDNWQSSRSRLRSKPATRSVAPSPYEIATNSSPDITTKSRQRTRGRNTRDPFADSQYNASDPGENRQTQHEQDATSQTEFRRTRNDNFRTTQHRTNIKTLEDSLNTEKYQRRGERPRNVKRISFTDQTEAFQPTEFPTARRREDGVRVEQTARRTQPIRSRVVAEKRSSTAYDFNQTPQENPSRNPPDADLRGTFRSRTTFQDASGAGKNDEIRKRGRTRGFTSRYQNVESTEKSALRTEGNIRGKTAPSAAVPQPSAVEINQELSRTPYYSTSSQQYSSDLIQFGQQSEIAGQAQKTGEAVFSNIETQQIDGKQQFKSRSDAVFPNLSTQQFSTDPVQFARARNYGPLPTSTIQEYPAADPNLQFAQGNVPNQKLPAQAPNLQFPDAQPQPIPATGQFPAQPESEVIRPDQHQIFRRIDSNEGERTPQFIPLETPKVRNNFRSRGRSTSGFSSTKSIEIGPESETEAPEPQVGRIRGRQSSFRSRSRVYTSPNDEASSSTTPPTSRTRTVTKYTSRSRSENVPSRNTSFRGRSRSQQGEIKPSQLEAKERIFTEELPETASESNDQSTQVPVKPISSSIKPFRGTVTAKITETQSEDDIDTTANYPKEFLDKLKSSKGFVPPPKRARVNLGSNGDQTFTSTALNARLKRKQYTTENYSRRDSDTSETIKKELQDEQTQASVPDKNQEHSTSRPTKERYSQRFYKKLAAESTGGTGLYSSIRLRATTEPTRPTSISRSKIPVRKTFKSASTSTTTTTTTIKPISQNPEFEMSTADQFNNGEERRKFVPKKKLTMEERKQRIAKLKEKLRQNATEGELKTEESQESFVIRESLLVQANTHPGSREVYTTERSKSTVAVKSSVTSNVKQKRGGPRKSKEETKLRDAEATSNKYDLITLGSEENVQKIFFGKNDSSTTTITPTTTAEKSETSTTLTTTARGWVSRTPRTVTTTPRPEISTQVPISTTTETDFAVLNVTLFPSTRHRFSARINSTTNISIPPDVELITTTTPSTVLTTPETFPSLERKPDLTLSVNNLFNSSFSTTTSASVEKATTGRSTALFNPSTQSISPSTTTQKSSTTTKRSSSKKKSSGRKKSKKTKSNTSGNRTTTKKSNTSKVSSKSAKGQNATTTTASTASATTTTTTTTVRTTTVNSTRNASNSNSTGVQPLSLAFSDIESIINETVEVVNSNPMSGPLPGVVPRSELNALTPETILNGTGSEDATEETAKRAETTTLSNTNSSDNSTNQVESPGRLTSGAECINGSCTKSKSQSLFFNEDNLTRAREPIPYARQKGTTKSPETLRKIFIYGIFPNNTVQRKPFPGGDDGSAAKQYNADSIGRQPATSTPSYTAGDYYVFGVYPNNSVVRRRGWKTFDYEKYHSPYVIFGIYPNNTIVKKYPNGTTINDEFMISDNEIRKTISDGKIYKGCTCEKAHPHDPISTTQMTESTTQRTTSTTEALKDLNEGKTEESETEEPERNAKDDAESIDFESENISEPGEEENLTTTESSNADEADEDENDDKGEEEEEEEEEGGEEEEKEDEKEQNESTTTTESISEELTKSTTPSSEESLDEAEKSDMVSTPDIQEEITTRASEIDESEGLENAEEADDSSTPRNLEVTTNSLEREETQNAGTSKSLVDAEEADIKDTSEDSNVDDLVNAEKADDSRISHDSTESSVNDTTERSENIEERTTAVTEFGEYTTGKNETTDERIKESLPQATTEGGESSEERTTTTKELGESITERSENTKERTEENLESRTTERSENLRERTTQSEFGENITVKDENLQEKTVKPVLQIEDKMMSKNENVEERTTDEIKSSTEMNFEEKNILETADDDSFKERSTERSESLEKRTTTTTENSDERTRENYYFESSTTERNKNSEEIITMEIDKTESSTSQHSESLAEKTTLINSYEDSTTIRSEALQESTTEGYESSNGRTTARSENAVEIITGTSYYFGDGTTVRSYPSNLQVVSTARNDDSEGGTTQRNKNAEERTTDTFGNMKVESYNPFSEGPLGEITEEKTTESITQKSEKKTFISDLLSLEEPESATTSSNLWTDNETPFHGIKDQEIEVAGITENTFVSDIRDTKEKLSTEGNLIIDLNSELGNIRIAEEEAPWKTTTGASVGVDFENEDIREFNELKIKSSGREGDGTTEVPKYFTTQGSDENTVPTSQERLESIKATTEQYSETLGRFDGYVYEKPTGKPFNLEDILGYGKGETETNVTRITTPPTTETTRFGEEETESNGNEETSTTDYDIDVRELGNLISRFTTGIFGETTATDPTGDGDPTATSEPSGAESTTDDILNALLPLSIEYIQASASGNAVKKRHRKAVNDLDEPSSLTNLAYRALSSSGTTPIPIPLLTTVTTRATKPSGPASPGRGKLKKIKNLSKTSVTAYKKLTNLTSTPLPDEVFIVTPVPSTRGHPDADIFKRGKIKFVTLTPGVVVTTNIHDENDILTMSSQHVQKVTKAPAKIPDNFLSTVFGEIEEKASSPIPDILKNVENDLQGDGLSASLARRIITLALEKAMTSTTPLGTPLSISATTLPTTTDPPTTTPIPQPSASYIQRITTPEPVLSTAMKKPTTTKKPKTTTKKPLTTTKAPETTSTTTTTVSTTTTTKKPIANSTTRKPRTTSSTTTTTTTTITETSKTILITPKKAGSQQANKNPSAAITSPEYLGSTVGPDISDGQANVEIVPLGIDPLTALFASEKPSAPTIPTTPSSQRVTEDLNVLLSGLWQDQSSPPLKLPKTSSSVPEPKKKSSKSKAALSKQVSASLSESDLRILEAILQQQGANGATQDLEQIVQNQIRLAEEVRKASRNLKKKPRPTSTTTTERPTPLGLGFLLNLFGAGSRPNGLFSNEPRNSRRQRPVLPSFTTLNNTTSVTPDPFNEPDEGNTTGERSARGELVSAAIDVTKAVSKFMGTVLTSAAQSFQNFFRNLGR